MSKPENPNAFPVSSVRPGMTLRDHFAGQALVGVMANNDVLTSVRAAYAREDLKLSEILALYAYRVADAMLEERNRT